jgi:hypothetical protein
MHFFKHVLLFLLFSFIPPNVVADSLYLQNGDHLSGELLNLSPTLCTFKSPYQTNISQIKRKHILRLSTDQRVVIELYSGERLIGTLSSPKNEILSLHSQQLGTFTISLSKVKQIRKSLLSSLLQKGEFQAIDPHIIHGKGTPNLKNSKSATEALTEKSVTIGQEEEENLKQLFLRNTAVLLNPGEKESEIFFGYTLDQNTDLRNRDLSVLGALRFGITKKLEGFLNVPVIWAEQENVSEENYSKSDNFGLGDMSLGFNYLFVAENKRQPDVIGSVAITMPTAEEPNMLAPETVALGSGQWHLTTVLNLVKNYDPAALFGGINYTHTFPHTFNDGIRVAPGDSFGYQFGFGFAINYQLALFSNFSGTYQMETERDNARVPGSVREPMSLRAGLSYAISKKNYLQPALTLGINDDAMDAMFGLSYIRRFE